MKIVRRTNHMYRWKRPFKKPTENSQQEEYLSSKNNRPKKNKEKAQTLENHLPKLKEQRRKTMYRRLIPLLLLFSCAILIVVYFISPLSKVGTISVTGNKDVTDQRIIDASHLNSGLPLWETVRKDEEFTSSVLEDIPQIKSAELNQNGWNDIAIEVTEHKVIAYSHDKSSYFPILENGKIVNESRKVSLGNSPIFKGFSEGRPLNLLIEQYQLLNASVQNSISEIEHTPSDVDEYLITIYMNDGNHVIATLSSFAEKMNYYPDMLKKVGDQKGTINLEVGGFFTPFESGDESSSQEEGKTNSGMESEEEE